MDQPNHRQNLRAEPSGRGWGTGLGAPSIRGALAPAECQYRTGFFLRTTTSFELLGGFAISVQVSDLSLDGLFELYLAFQGDTQLDTYGILLHGDGTYSVGHGTGSGFPGPPLGQGTVVTSGCAIRWPTKPSSPYSVP